MSGRREREVEGKIAALHHLAEHPTLEGAQILIQCWDDDYYRDPNRWRAADDREREEAGVR